MQLQAVEIPREGAREQAVEYMRAARSTSDPDTRGELEQIARAYRFAAQEGLQMIALTPTLVAGGTMQRTHVPWRGAAPRKTLLPRLAVMRSDARFAYTTGIQEDGSIELTDRLYARPNLRLGRLRLETTFTLPSGFHAGGEIGTWTGAAYATMVPLVPPKARPRRNAALRNLLTLWEVEDWQWTEQARPRTPVDPALLQHVGGDIYAVLATWNLTELERLVLTDRRPAEGR